MKIQDLLKMMESKAMDADFRKEIFNYYYRDEDFTEIEADFNAAKNRLEGILTPEQARSLATLESLYAQDRDAAASWGFRCGLYGGFRQHFAHNTDLDGGFYSLVCGNPGTMRKYKDAHRDARCRELIEYLEKEAPEDAQAHILSIDYAWQERIYNAAFQGFYCGYRGAYSIIDQIDLSSRMNNICKILTTEFYLGKNKPQE